MTFSKTIPDRITRDINSLVGPAAWALHRSSRKLCHSYLPKRTSRMTTFFLPTLVVGRPPAKDIRTRGQKCISTFGLRTVTVL